MKHIEGKVGWYHGNSADLAKRCSPDFIPMPMGREEVEKYAMIIKERNNSYMVMISNMEKRSSEQQYNTILTVTGSQEQRTKEIIDELAGKTGIEMRPAPDWLMERQRTALRIFGF